MQIIDIIGEIINVIIVSALMLFTTYYIFENIRRYTLSKRLFNSYIKTVELVFSDCNNIDELNSVYNNLEDLRDEWYYDTDILSMKHYNKCRLELNIQYNIFKNKLKSHGTTGTN